MSLNLTLPSLSDPANFNADALTLFNEINNIEASDFFGIIGTVSQSGGNATGDLFEEGSGANGYFLRLASGTQICRHDVTLNFDSSSACTATWTYPAAFSASPSVIGTVKLISGATPNENQLNPLRSPSAGATSATLRLGRITGQTDFQSGDTVTCTVIAVGKWF